MDNLNIMDEYMEMYNEVYEILDDVEMDIEEFVEITEDGNCECCSYYLSADCHLQCTHE